eukprot:245547_1
MQQCTNMHPNLGQRKKNFGCGCQKEIHKSLPNIPCMAGGRISITNKRCELRDMAWWNIKLKYKALLVEEINKNIWVWLIDENNIVRAFDYDAASWDSAKEFQ